MSEITEEMIVAAAEAMEDAAIELIGRDLGTIHRNRIAERGLRAALAGRTVVDLPEPDQKPRLIPPGLAEWDGYWGPTWISEQRPHLVASWHLGDDMTPDDAEALALALLAAVRKARLASGFSESGEPT